jgi:hypothetical protein
VGSQLAEPGPSESVTILHAADEGADSRDRAASPTVNDCVRVSEGRYCMNNQWQLDSTVYINKQDNRDWQVSAASYIFEVEEAPGVKIPWHLFFIAS